MADSGVVERRDLVTLVVNCVGAVVETDVLWEPYRLVDPGGGVVASVTEFLHELQASGRSAATQRSYALDLFGPPCVFRIDLIRVVRPLAADSGNRYELPVGFGSPTLSGDVWYCSGARCSVSRLCGLVRALGTRCG
jgi:hypothetical protein